MTINYIAAVIESFYYNGKLKINDQKMDIDDFTQLAIAANGTVMRQIWYEEGRMNDPLLYFAGSRRTERFKIEKMGRYRTAIIGERSFMKLPGGAGILAVMPLMSEKENECEEFDNGDIFLPGKPGMESGFGSVELLDDIGEAFFVVSGNHLRLFGFEAARFVEVEVIPNHDKMDIPEDAAWRIINLVLGPVLKVVGFPVDPTNDGNPNVIPIKKALAPPQDL